MPVAEQPDHCRTARGDAGSDTAEPATVETDPIAGVPLLAPVAGVPPVLDTAEEVVVAAAELASGTGPLAVDAERASGFRYSARAYLIQLRRAGAGTVLIDPIPIADALGPLAEVTNDLEWVLHSADQDLPCLAALGLHPAQLFDTELGGRLAGFDRVGLAAMVERLLGHALRKGHGAADWSTRPLPDDWLNYAALDVELLLELRAAVDASLREQGKTDWAAQEFEHVRASDPPVPKTERWRRTSGIHTLRRTRQLATVRELWTARESVARSRDVAPARVLPDSAIIAAADAEPQTMTQLRALPVFRGPRQRRYSRQWLTAIERARTLPESELPPLSQPSDGPSPVNRWERRDPVAAARLSRARAAMSELSEQVDVPMENLLAPDLLRRLCWDGLSDYEQHADASVALTAAIDLFLKSGGVRPWQRELAIPRLAEALPAPNDK